MFQRPVSASHDFSRMQQQRGVCCRGNVWSMTCGWNSGVASSFKSSSASLASLVSHYARICPDLRPKDVDRLGDMFCADKPPWMAESYQKSLISWSKADDRNLKVKDLHLIVQGRTKYHLEARPPAVEGNGPGSESTRSCEVWSEDKSCGPQSKNSANLTSARGDSGAVTRFTQLTYVSRQPQDRNLISMPFIDLP